MYRLNAPLGENALELGRLGVFNYGWLENGSIFLHMHYKFVLEKVRAGLIEEFYGEMDKLLVSIRDPMEYRRNPVENSSFLVSSGFAVGPRQHGRGCVARLSGSTVEFLHLWTHLFLGAAPFVFAAGQLHFRPAPVLAKTMFSTRQQTVNPFGVEETLPADSAACALFGATLLVYINPERQDTFGPAAVSPCRYLLYGRDGSLFSEEGRELQGQVAESLRQGYFRRLDVSLGGYAAPEKVEEAKTLITPELQDYIKVLLEEYQALSAKRETTYVSRYELDEGYGDWALDPEQYAPSDFYCDEEACVNDGVALVEGPTDYLALDYVVIEATEYICPKCGKAFYTQKSEDAEIRADAPAPRRDWRRSWDRIFGRK